MKKFTLFTFLFLMSMTFAMAQNPISNFSFENWVTAGSGQRPASWQSTDSVSMSGSTPSSSAVQEIIEKCDLSSSIKMTTWVYYISGFPIATVPGMATNGIVNVNTSTGSITFDGGDATSVRHANFKGCYKYTPADPGNIALISAYLLKRNGSTRDTIAAAILNPATAGSMTSFDIPFAYRSTQSPDTIIVILGSTQSIAIGSANANVGSVLIIDSVGVSGIVSSVEENTVFKNVKVYPQPATGDALNIDVTFGRYTKATYTLIDGLGRMVMNGNLEEKQQINIASLANGVYTLTLNNMSGDRLYSTRVNVNH